MRQIWSTFAVVPFFITIVACVGQEVQPADVDFPDIPIVADIAIGPDNDVYLVEWDANGHIRRFTEDGEAVGWTEGEEALHCPFAVTIDDAGYAYVLTAEPDGEPHEHVRRIEVVGPDGALGGTLAIVEEGALDIAADNSDRLYVPLSGEAGIRVFDRDGAVVGDWWADDMPFSRPVGVAFDEAGNVVVKDIRDDSQSAVTILTPEGDLISQWEVGALPASETRWAVSVSVDGEGNIVLMEWQGRDVFVYTPEGDLLREFDPREALEERGSGETTDVPDCPALQLPARVQAGPDGRLYWTPSWDTAWHLASGIHVLEYVN